MKKILLTTSALAGVTTAALAGVVMVAGSAAAEAPTVTMTGSIDYYIRWADKDQPGAGGDVEDTSPGWDINSHDPASELVWDVNATADNGLQFGANVQLRPGSANTDEMWIDFAGNWGRVVIGDDDGVNENNSVSGVSVMPIGAWDTGRFSGGWTNAALAGPALIGESGDASKIAYYSPSFAGFTAAASIAPDASSSFGSDNNTAFQSCSVSNTTGAISCTASNEVKNSYELALKYSGTFDAVGVTAYAGYVGGTYANDGLTRDVGGYQLGATVSFAGFSVGAGYGDNDDAGIAQATTNGDAGNWWDVGVSYNYGAGSVGVGYFTSSENAGGAATGDDEFEVFSIEGTYTVAQGLTAYGGVSFSESDPRGPTGSTDDTVLVLGTRVNF